MVFSVLSNIGFEFLISLSYGWIRKIGQLGFGGILYASRTPLPRVSSEEPKGRPPSHSVSARLKFYRGLKGCRVPFLSTPQKSQRWTSLPILYRAVTITQPNSASSCLSWIFVELVSYCPQIALQTPMVSFKDRRVHRVIIGLQSFMEGISLNVRLDFAFFSVDRPPQHLVFFGTSD